MKKQYHFLYFEHPFSEWASIIRASGISKDDVVENPDAMLAVMNFTSSYQMGGALPEVSTEGRLSRFLFVFFKKKKKKKMVKFSFVDDTTVHHPLPASGSRVVPLRLVFIFVCGFFS